MLFEMKKLNIVFLNILQLTFSPFCISFDDLVHESAVFVSLTLIFTDFFGVASFIGPVQVKIQNHFRKGERKIPWIPEYYWKELQLMQCTDDPHASGIVGRALPGSSLVVLTDLRQGAGRE